MDQKNNLSQHVRVSLNQDFTEYGLDGKPNVRFLRAEVTNLYPAIQSIVEVIADTSWMDELLDESIRAGFMAAAEPTINKLKRNLEEAVVSEKAETVGEYIVSMVASYIIEAEYGYKALPLAEIIKEQISGNPGFDFHHQKDELILIFGEAKYKTGRSGYADAFSQIVSHIAAKKDLKELPALRDFVADGAKENMRIGKKGYSAAFSTSRKGFDSGALIANIKANADFVSLVEHEALLIVAVDVNG